jgi:hypothetical protein
MPALENLRRASKRQAAPHSKGTHVKHPKRSGRVAGAGYGSKVYRNIPEHADKTLEGPCPATSSAAARWNWTVLPMARTDLRQMQFVESTDH